MFQGRDKALIALIVGLLVLTVAIFWLAYRQQEGFTSPEKVLQNLAANGEGIPDPKVMMGALRSLLDKYDQPALWEHATAVARKSPTELARLNMAPSK